MKKLFLGISLVCLLLVFFAPFFTQAQGPLVTCGNTTQNPCGIGDFFAMLAKIYEFIVLYIAAPLAVLMLTIGGVMILISAGNPNLAGTGKKILWTSIIGLVLAFCSYLIIETILRAVAPSLSGRWTNPF